MALSAWSLAEILGGHGYRRAAVVSNSLLTEAARNGFGQGFERYLESEAQGHNHVSSEAVTDQAIHLLGELSRGRDPFFLFVLYFDPHYNWIEHPELGLAPREGRGTLRGTPHIRELSARRAEYTGEEIRYLRELYDGEIRYTDLGVRRLLAALDEMGRAGDTVVALTADHGEEFRERGWIGHTRTLYEELVRVPLVVSGPGIPAGRLVREPVSLVAAAPTLMELMGLETAGLPFQEASFAGRARGAGGGEGDSGAPSLAFSEVDFDPVNPANEDKRAHKKTIVAGDWKLVRDDTTGALELFDLAADPGERSDLSADRPELRDRLLALLQERQSQSQASATAAEARELTEEELERLRGLGYVQ
jgi:arylsulfatase